jgi:hypothetical protein
LVLASSWLDGVTGDLALEDRKVASFIVANLLDAIICGVWEAKGSEGGDVENFNALLVEGEDNPFG